MKFGPATMKLVPVSSAETGKGGTTRTAMESLLGERWGRWVLFILGWAALSLLFAPETYLSFYLRKAPISWHDTLQLTLVSSAIALMFIPAIVLLARRFPLERRRWRAALLVHAPACVAFSLGHSALYTLLCAVGNEAGTMMFFRFHPNLLTYWAVVGFTQAFDYFRKYQARERQVAQLQLEILKAQLHPHFLFNTLHTISAMMHADIKRADRMLSRLSELLRLTLASIGQQEVRLAEEIAFVRAYLEIERERFGERLETQFDVAPEALDALVPALLLQPLVENSIRHGFAPNRKDGLIRIAATREDSQLILTIEDNGRGLPSLAQMREGVGVANSRQRLEQLYPQNHSFRIEAGASAGVVVTAEIPFRSARDTASIIGEFVNNEHSSADRGRRALGAHANSYIIER